MAAVTVNTTTTVLVAADPDNWRRVHLQNDGPTNAMYLEAGATATVAGGLTVPVNTGRDLHLPPGTALNAIAATAAVTARVLVI